MPVQTEIITAIGLTAARYGNYVAPLLEMLRAYLHSLTRETFKS